MRMRRVENYIGRPLGPAAVGRKIKERREQFKVVNDNKFRRGLLLLDAVLVPVAHTFPRNKSPSTADGTRGDVSRRTGRAVMSQSELHYSGDYKAHGLST